MQAHHDGQRPAREGVALSRADCRATCSGASTGSNDALATKEQQQQQASWASMCHAVRQDSDGAMRRAACGVVAIVTDNGTWGSGVTVCSSQGYIVTNAHLLAATGRAPTEGAGGGSVQQSTAQVRVQLWPDMAPSTKQPGLARSVWSAARVLHVFQGPLDLAVLQLRGADRAHLQPLCLRDTPAHPGEPVSVVGFPLVPPRKCMGPFTTAGIVAKVISQHA
jgi:S1-C subfamily serine protease